MKSYLSKFLTSKSERRFINFNKISFSAMLKRTDVVLYSNENSEKLRDLLRNIFSNKKFVIYEVDRNQLISKCWFDMSSHLIINKNITDDEDVKNIIRDVIFNKRYTLVLSNKIDHNCLKVDCLLFEFLNDDIMVGKIGDDVPLIMTSLNSLMTNTENIAKLWNLFPFAELEVPYHTDVYLFSQNSEKCSKFLELMKSSNIAKEEYFKYSDFQFTINLSESDSLPSHKLFSYINANDINQKEILSFSSKNYFRTLRTKIMGQTVLYSEVLGSSYDLMDRFLMLTNIDMGLVIISQMQTQGKGRGNNKWVSPIGCAMFTCCLTININSYLGGSMCLIQHVLAVSIVESICMECQINDDCLKIKWPNDIYWINRGKISGIISKASTFDKKFNCILGCGINVSNNDPTVCIHDIIRESDINKLPEIETIIANVMNYFEMNIVSIQAQSNGIQKFKEKYYKYWMHQNQKVTIKNENTNVPGTICGIDNFGFLEMIPDDIGSNGSIISLHPDGNSFDMMHNLIIPKK